MKEGVRIKRIDEERRAVLRYLEGLDPGASTLVFGERMFEDSNIWTLEPHRHTFIELIYITDGNLRIDVPGRQLNKPTGSLIVYPSGVLHREYLQRQERERIICIGIKMPERAALETSFEADDPDGRLRRLMESMLSEYTDRNEGWDIISRNCVEDLCILLKRSFADPARHKNDFVARCVSYIQTHLTEDIDVETLSRIAYVSPSHLTRCMRERIGCAPNAYVKACRLELAKRKLTALTDPIEQIAGDCGFTDPKYFSRAFKQETGMTPSEYRAAFSKNDSEEEETADHE